METRLLVAYLLIVLLLAAAGAALWWGIHNSPNRRLRREYRTRHAKQREAQTPPE